MSSTQRIDFSIRQNKAIERAIAFDALADGQRYLGDDPIYVGLGSVWFRDFQMAHRLLNINTMISIESDDEIYRRAEFNRPFNNIEVIHGLTYDVIPQLLQQDDLRERPWIVWLDYDSTMNQERLEELTSLVTDLADGSALLVTFNAQLSQYANDTDRRYHVLVDLFGEDNVPDASDLDSLKGYGFMRTMANCVLNHLSGFAIHQGRSGQFVRAIRVLYEDSTKMITVGGFLPSSNNLDACRAMVASIDWCGLEDSVIKAQPLTLREMQALWQLLPSSALSSEDVSSLGFDLSEEQLRLVQRHYLRYPFYAEIA